MTAVLSGCGGVDGDAPDAVPTSSAPEETPPELVRAADELCTEARAELTRLGDEVDPDPSVPDPLLESLIRPGAEIYARLAEKMRALTAPGVTTESVATYVGYFELLDAVVNARLEVGQPNGPQVSETRSLEARFQSISSEQAIAATAAGLDACSFDVNETIFAS